MPVMLPGAEAAHEGNGCVMGSRHIGQQRADALLAGCRSRRLHECASDPATAAAGMDDEMGEHRPAVGECDADRADELRLAGLRLPAGLS